MKDDRRYFHIILLLCFGVPHAQTCLFLRLPLDFFHEAGATDKRGSKNNIKLPHDEMHTSKHDGTVRNSWTDDHRR